MSEYKTARSSVELKHLTSIGDQHYPSVELRYLLAHLRNKGETEWCDALVHEFDLGPQLTEQFLPSYLALECNNRIVAQHFYIGMGIEVGSNYGLDDFGILGAALRHAPSLYEALNIALAYYELIGSFTDLSIIEGQNTFTSRFVNVSGLTDELEHLLFELTVSGMLSLGRLIANREITVEVLRFRLKLDTDQHAFFEQRFNCKVESGAKFNEWVLNLDELKLGIEHAPRAKGELSQSIEELNALIHTIQNEYALVDRLDELAKENDESFPNSKEMADALYMSERTFRRKLKNIGLNYNMLMGKIRCQLAIAMLQKGSYTNEDIAFELGFSDAANFCNAFKKWTGQTPNYYRP